jgi:protein-L-isoaspartate(D-aspartate) O-methyltransferase
MESNEALVDYLREYGFLKSKRVEAAFRAVDRAVFVPKEYSLQAYVDYPLPVLKLQTISAPSVVAIMTEALDVEEGMKVLEVGAGSGYQAAVLSHIVGSRGRVVTIERFRELCDYAGERLARLPFTKNVVLVNADGSRGYPEEAPFDRVIVTAGAPRVPEPLVEQLKEGGRIVIPVGEQHFQDLRLGVKKKGRMEFTSLLPVMFVPLTGEHGFKET